MNEKNARYNSLFITGMGILLIYIVFCLFGMGISRLEVKGETPSFSLLLTLSIFTAFGILLLLSAFFKHVYHVLVMLELGLCIYAFYYAYDIDSTMILIALFVISPHLIYYIELFRIHRNKKILSDDKNI